MAGPVSAGVTKQQEGLLPSYYHPVLILAIGTSYGLLQRWLLRQFARPAPVPHRL